MKKEKKVRLTSALNVTIAPELKDIVDQAAFDAGLPTNEFVAAILAKAMNRPDLAKIPRKPFGRPRTRVMQPA